MTKSSQLNQYQMSSASPCGKYFSVVHLLDEIGPWDKRLESVYHIVKAPTFSYVKSPTATYLSAALANSSYWLSDELFNEEAIQKDLDDKTLQGEQKAHVWLLEIGSTLIDKGFPLKPGIENIYWQKTSPLYTYAKTFVMQCQKRNARTKKTILCQRTRPLCPQKENVR